MFADFSNNNSLQYRTNNTDCRKNNTRQKIRIFSYKCVHKYKKQINKNKIKTNVHINKDVYKTKIKFCISKFIN